MNKLATLAFLRNLSRPFVVICTALLISACIQAVKTEEPEPEPEPDPEPPALPTLLGTWQRVDTNTDDDGARETHTTTLTFTTSRFIVFNVLSRSGVAIDDWSESGALDQYRHHRHENLDRRSLRGVRSRSSKEYHWGDAERNTLLVHHWEWGDPATSFERYTRLADPISGGLTGTWIHRGTWDHGDLGEVQQTLTFAITTDTFTELDRNVYPNGDVEINTRSGSLTVDQENQFLKVAVTSASLEWNGVSDEDFDDTESVGHEFRYGYAASGQPDKLSVSVRWEEQDWNDETMMYENSEEFPLRQLLAAIHPFSGCSIDADATNLQTRPELEPAPASPSLLGTWDQSDCSIRRA